MEKIKLQLLTALMLLFVTSAFAADNNFEGALTRNGALMSVAVNVDLGQREVKSNEALLFTPLLVNGSDTLQLKSAGVYGRTAWYQYQRGIFKTLPKDQQTAFKYNKKLDQYTLEENIPYEEWMNGSELVVKEQLFGCASCRKEEETSDMLAYYMEEGAFTPELIYMAAIDEGVKSRELSGRAYVDFPVNKIVIYPEYRNNTYELGKIIATIDSVRNDPDITVTSIHIAGTASPEGPYDNNVYLAKNRTIALKDYVTTLYNFPKDFIQTDYDPVDWKGLREWLENHNLNHKEEILAIVNSDIEPYARNSKIRTDFPTEYDWLLKNVYPALRHSDYRIEYQIRQFTTVEEIAEVMKTAPQKLSLSEFYRYVSTLTPGTDDYNEVFETAVRLFPEDETANLNAANNALSRGDLAKAEKYLAKAGQSAEAVYARGMLLGLQGDFTQGLPLILEAQSAGLPVSDTMIQYFTRHSAK